MSLPLSLVTVFPSGAQWLHTIIHTGRRVRPTLTALAVVLAIPVFCLVAATPQPVVDELLAADRAFSAASAETDVVTGLSATFATDVVIPNPPGQFIKGKSAVVAALNANLDNARSHTEWTPVRGGISADGQHGFTAGFIGPENIARLVAQGQPRPAARSSGRPTRCSSRRAAISA